MKKVSLFILAAGLFLVSCKDENKKTDSIEVTTPSVAYKVSEGDVTRKDGKVLVYTNGTWVVVESDIVLADGTVITKDGEIKKGEKIIVLEEGGVISKTGEFFDKTGAAIENAWEKTKEGVSNVATDVKEGAEKAWDKTKDAAEKVADKTKEAANKVGDATKAGVDAVKKELKKD